MSKYIITYNGKKLNYRFGNNCCCGKVSDQIGFSNNSYKIYDSEQQARQDINRMISEVNDYTYGENVMYGLDRTIMALRLQSILNKCKVKPYL